MNCATDQLTENVRQRDSLTVPDSGGSVAGQQLLDLRMAIETDHQYYTNWNNLQACKNYTVALLDAASDRYESQVGVVLTFPYLQYHTNQFDGWDSQDSGGGCGDVLNEFVNAWAGNIPLDAHLGHFLSGANLGCGVAYLDVICNENNGFANLSLTRLTAIGKRAGYHGFTIATGCSGSDVPVSVVSDMATMWSDTAVDHIFSVEIDPESSAAGKRCATRGNLTYSTS